jgi:hypothetical protein
MASSSTNNLVILTEPKLYDAWYDQLRHHISQQFFEDYIDPENPFPVPPPPRCGAPPNPRNGFPTERVYTTELAAYEAWKDNQTGPQPLEPVFTLASLTKVGRDAYELSLKEYQLGFQAWKAYNDSYEGARKHISHTVGDRYRNALETKLSVREWLVNLTQECALSNHEKKEEARKIYKQVVTITEAALRKEGVDKWLARWDQAIVEGRRRRVPETLDAAAWLTDFMTAISSIYPDWARVFILAKKDEVLAGTMTHRDVVREATTQIKPSRSAAGPSRAGRGAFTASIADITAIGEEQVPERAADRQVDPGDRQRGHGRSRGSGRSRGRGRIERSKERSRSPPIRDQYAIRDRRIRCKACNHLNHTHTGCYYAVPSIRPDGWFPATSTMHICKLLLENDPKLRQECEEADAKAKAASRNE